MCFICHPRNSSNTLWTCFSIRENFVKWFSIDDCRKHQRLTDENLLFFMYIFSGKTWGNLFAKSRRKTEAKGIEEERKVFSRKNPSHLLTILWKILNALHKFSIKIVPMKGLQIYWVFTNWWNWKQWIENCGKLFKIEIYTFLKANKKKQNSC